MEAKTQAPANTKPVEYWRFESLSERRDLMTLFSSIAA